MMQTSRFGHLVLSTALRFLLFCIVISSNHSSLAASGAGDEERSNLVILLSWDGMRHDFPERGSYPALRRIEAEGIRAGRLTPVYLSNTFPGHVSLATGAEPNVHGIVDNVFYDRARGGVLVSFGQELSFSKLIFV